MDTLLSLLSASDTDQQRAVDYASNNVDRLVSDWAYAAGTSNHGAFGSSSLALAKTFELPGLPQEIRVKISQKLIGEELKTFYRALTIGRHGQTSPAIALLTQIAKTAPTDLFNQFDFTLGAIPKLLSSQTFRHAFLGFYMELIRASTPAVRRDLLANRKIFGAWVGKLGMDDSEDFVRETLALFRDLVLKDTRTFTKSTKMGLFNDWTLRNLAKLLGTASPDLGSEIAAFLVMLLSDKSFGVRAIGSQGENKLALSFLKIVKPWENLTQMDLAIRLLKEIPSLVVPYFEALAPAYPLTPRTSMWWFSYSTLHIRALKLPAPFEGAVNEFGMAVPAPSLDSASKTVVPVTATKAALMQGILFKESNLVRFQTAQIVLHVVRRLRSVLTTIYEPRRWDVSALIDEVLQRRLPEVQIFAKPTEPPLLQTTYLEIVNEICRLRPLNFSIPLSLEAKEVSGLQLVQAQTVLEIQTVTSETTRWWNPSKDEYSLFTQLLKFATFNLKLADKCSELLKYLVGPTQIFADIETVAHPVDALLFIVATRPQSDLLWLVLEQSLQRSVKTPYQFIDQVESLRVSPFIVAFVEQYVNHFANRDSDGSIRDWIKAFARSLIVIGEDETVLNELLSQLGRTQLKKTPESPSEPMSDEYYDFVLDAPTNAILGRNDLVYKISNLLELAATLYRGVTTTSSSLQNHLLASIPADMMKELTRRPAYQPYVSSGNREHVKAFLAVLDGHSSEDLSHDLERIQDWDLGIALESSEFLLRKVIEEHDVKCLKELTSRSYKVPLDAIDELINMPGIALNMSLWPHGSVTRERGRELLAKVQSDAHVFAEIVRLSGEYDPRNALAIAPLSLVAAAKYSPSHLNVDEALSVAKHLLIEGDFAGLQIAAALKDRVDSNSDSDLWQAISSYVEAGKSSLKRDVLRSELATLAGGAAEASFVARWLKIVVLQLTKRYAEHSITEENRHFLITFGESTLEHINIWQKVHHGSLNALIQAAIHNTDALNDEETLELLTRVVLAADTKIESTNHLTSLLDESHTGKLLTNKQALLLYLLYWSQPEQNATLDIEQGILAHYTASLATSDRLLLSILSGIEEVRQRSWVDHVESWEVRPAASRSAFASEEYGRDPLIVLRSKGVFVTLDEERIRRTVQQFERFPSFTPPEIRDYKSLILAAEKAESLLPTGYSDLYDTRFLLQVVVSCNYLYEHLEIFLGSGLISFAICCISDTALEEAATNVLAYTFKATSPEDATTTFKDQTALHVLLGKLLLLQRQRHDQGMALPSHVAVMCGQIALILAKPSHFLYEKISSWLLSSPRIQPHELPLFEAIASSQSEFRVREVLWLVNTLKSGAVSLEAVETYIKQGVVDWCLSRYHLLSPRAKVLKEAIMKLLERIEEIRGGSMALITSSAALGVTETAPRLVCSAGEQNVAAWIDERAT